MIVGVMFLISGVKESFICVVFLGINLRFVDVGLLFCVRLVGVFNSVIVVRLVMRVLINLVVCDGCIEGFLIDFFILVVDIC